MNLNQMADQSFKVPKSILRYFRRELYKSISFVMVAFVGLFAFFDLIGEVDRLSQPGTNWFYYVVAITLGLPARVYEIAPIAALIGSIYALVQLAASSELTAMRAAGMSTTMMLKLIIRIASGVVLLTVLFGEGVAPAAERAAVPMRAKALGFEVDRDFRSGYWLRDTYQSPETGTRVRFVNFGGFDRDGDLKQVEYYEMDAENRVRQWVRAGSASYNNDTRDWTLSDVRVQNYFDAPVSNERAAKAGLTIQASPVRTLDTLQWKSNLAPELLTGLFVRPDRMSAWQLYNYSRFLKSNQQATDNIDLAFAKKVMYPFAILIMMMISLPFAYLHFRSGGVSVKVFVGIMIGVGFHLINNLFSHLSMVASLPPFLSASMPTVIGFVLGMGSLWWVSQPAPWRLVERLFNKRPIGASTR
ncbi:MAG TPA: LPS export ABC transporter permease LptG [Limnobacter sp.]|uniref:LPS export ABC transporter permease LptG n=1 Tax=Limnobacter sp. TaxID=2003368 RepID=UPI002EDB4BDF